MATTIYRKNETDRNTSLPVNLGGLGSNNLIDGAKNIGLLTKDMLDVPNGVAVKNSSGKIKLENIPSGLINRAINLKGPTETFINTSIDLEITDYDSFLDYNLEVDTGFASRKDNIITYTAAEEAGYMSLSVNDILFPILVKEPGVYKPTIQSPSANKKVNSSFSYVIGDEFKSLVTGDEHIQSQVDVSRYVDFSVIEGSYSNHGVDIDKNIVPIMLEDVGSEYFIRLRYQGSKSGWSSWSRTKRIVTTPDFYPAYEVGMMVSNDPHTNTRFGSSVAVNGKGTIAAVATAGIGLENAKVYIFNKVQGIGNWVLETVHEIKDLSTGSHLGVYPNCLAMNSEGNVIAIGGPNANAGRGIVYVISKNEEGEWETQASLKSPESIANEYYGYSLSLNAAGTVMAIGAPTANREGRVYLYSFNGKSWLRSKVVKSANKQISDLFGTSVSLSSDSQWLVVGAPGTASSVGRAYLYKYNESWEDSHIVIPKEEIGMAQFGYSVSINEDGSVMAIGAPGLNKVYTYKVAADAYLLTNTLTETDNEDFNEYGSIVKINDKGTMVAVGTVTPGTLSNSKRNMVMITTLDKDQGVTGNWKLVGGDIEGSEAFSYSIALSKNGEALLVGAPLKTINNVVDSGSAYMFN